MEKDGLRELCSSIFGDFHTPKHLPAETENILRRAVDGLPYLEKLVVTETFFKGTPLAEIAKICRYGKRVGITETTAQRHLCRALKMLSHSPGLVASLDPMRSGKQWARLFRKRAKAIANQLAQQDAGKPMPAAEVAKIVMQALAGE